MSSKFNNRNNQNQQQNQNQDQQQQQDDAERRHAGQVRKGSSGTETMAGQAVQGMQDMAAEGMA